MCGALLAVARKCDRLREEFERFVRELDGRPDAKAVRALAARQAMRMTSEAEEARRHAGALREIAGKTSEETIRTRSRAQSRYRKCAAYGRFAEYFVIPFLRGYDDEAVMMTKLCREIAETVAWPSDSCPLVSRGASNYFHFVAEEGEELILAPALAGTTVLPLPDLVHEMAHPVVRDSQRRETILGPWHREDFVIERVIEKLGDGRFGKAAVRHWIDHGFEEIACDIIAAFVAGPAYGWQHVRACWGREGDKSVHEDGDHHPPDSGRFAVIQLALAQVAGEEERAELTEVWNGVVLGGEEGGEADLEGYYPLELMLEFAEEVLRGCVRAGIKPYSDQLPADDPRSRFNDAWKQMRFEPFEFDASERFISES